MYDKFKAHPWHGIHPGKEAPNLVTSFIEITPHDNVKYEIDKESGYLKIDRPQMYSNIIPALYGFIPQTYCGRHIANHCMKMTGRTNIQGDMDPIDICILTERHIVHGNILINAIPIGGFRMIDNNEADDKIIAIMEGDKVFGQWQDIDELPETLRQRLLHYFLTYKQIPNPKEKAKVEITHTYNREEALEIIRLSMMDYRELIELKKYF